jgi:hypothetical protein
MAILEAINLNRRWGRIVPTRPPRSQSEFHILHVVTRGLDALLAGEQLDEEFLDFLDFARQQPAFQEALLRYAPVLARTQ